MGSLSGKVVLITGAAKNIGRATALTFAADGAAVAINALTSKAEGEQLVREIRDAGGRAALYIADISNGGAVKSMVESIAADFGRLDFLVLNASIRKRIPFLELSFEQWQEPLSTTLSGAFFCVQNCLPHMIKAGGGAIVMLCGANSLSGAVGRVNGSVAKHGLVGMSRALAREFAPQGIRVNCVAPGPIATVKRATHGSQPTPMTKVPLARQGQPQEIADMVHFLCTSKASYVTGQIMHVNGGVLMGA